MLQESYEHIIKYVTTTPENTNKNVLVTLFNNIKNDKEETDTSDKVIKLIDWEGTVLKEYTKNEIEKLAELPTPDTFSTYNGVDHELLLFQNWNWSLEDIKAWSNNNEKEELIVGAIYTTTDGQDHDYWIVPRADVKALINKQKRGTISFNDYAFYRHFSLESINIPYGNTSVNLSSFGSCNSLKAINIPNGVTSIGNGAFSVCYSLSSISIPNSVTSIGEYAFNDCDSLKSINIPDSVESIGYYAFDGCDSLTFLKIPNSVTFIDNSAFSNCKALKTVEISNNITTLNGIFGGCYSLKNVNIPDGVTSIGNHTFSNCYSLISANIPDSVVSIGYNAFYYCLSLPSIKIPEKVTLIDSNTFYGCDNLFDIILEGKPILVNVNAFGSGPLTQKFYVPRANISWFENTTNWATYCDRFVAIEDNIAYLESLGYNVDKYKN